MGIEKYRVHEVAKDFGLPTKTITEILTKYAETPKNHMQALTDQELSLIFDYLTQHNQVSSIQVIFADTYKDGEEGGARRQTKAGSLPSPPRRSRARAAASQPGRPGPQPEAPGGEAQAALPSSRPAPLPRQSPVVQQPASRVPQKKIVDTRKGGDVNLAKYDQRLEELGGERGDRMQPSAAARRRSAPTTSARAASPSPTSAGRTRRRRCAASSWRSPRRPPSRS